MNLTGIQHKQLQKALISAFPSKSVLAQMVRQQLEVNLAAIADGKDLSEVIFNLINWAESEGRIDELITKARAENNGNKELRDFGDQYMLARSADPSTPSSKHNAEEQVYNVFLRQTYRILKQIRTRIPGIPEPLPRDEV